jgi:hypothetical protein
MRGREHGQRGHPLRPAVGDVPAEAAFLVVADEMEARSAAARCRDDIERVAEQPIDGIGVKIDWVGTCTDGVAALVRQPRRGSRARRARRP